MPRFQHDCEQCVYLETQVINGQQVDWYHHPGRPHVADEGSIIGRRGNDGDYWSAPVAILRRLRMEGMALGRMGQIALEILDKPEAT